MRNEQGLGHPVTPDRRYFVVRGRLWQMSDPSLAPDERQSLVKQLKGAPMLRQSPTRNRRMQIGLSVRRK